MDALGVAVGSDATDASSDARRVELDETETPEAAAEKEIVIIRTLFQSNNQPAVGGKVEPGMVVVTL
jgi:hypothetical protein